MRTYHGVVGRMLFTYAQLSPRGKEGSEEVERMMSKAMRKLNGGREEEKRGAKVHRVASEQVREKEKVMQRVSTFPHGSAMPR